VGLHEIDGLLAGPALGVQAGVDHEARRAPGLGRKHADAREVVLEFLDFLLFAHCSQTFLFKSHGGRVGYDKEWRNKPELSGGGELIDQGPHLIDLSRWFLGEFTEVQGFAHTYYWDMPVDDNGFLLLKTAKRQVAFLHASCTEWKNMFSMEIYGRNAKLEITGLGGSYGLERLTYYKMLPEMGPPETTAWEYPMGDDSWSVEMAEFYDDIRLNRQPAAGLNDAFEALKVIEMIYKVSGYDHCP